MNNLELLRMACEINGETDVLGTFPNPLLPGDEVDAILLDIATELFAANDTASATIEVYACNAKPASAAEARGGVALLAPIALPLRVDYSNGTDAIFGQTVSLPLLFVCGQSSMWIAVVATYPLANTIGAAFLKVFRGKKQ
jgi:predicted metal-binding membrane protein